MGGGGPLIDAADIGRGTSLGAFLRLATDGWEGKPGWVGTTRPGIAGAAPGGGLGAPKPGGLGADDLVVSESDI